MDTNQEFSASANYAELAKEDIHIIFEVAEKKSVLTAQINAFFADDKIQHAYIISAKSAEDSTSNIIHDGLEKSLPER